MGDEARADAAQSAAQRVNTATHVLKERSLALEREENYANRTNATVNYLEAQMDNAKNNLDEVRTDVVQTAVERLKEQLLAFGREENFANKTNETVHYLEAWMN